MPPPVIANTLARHWDASVLSLADGASITSWADLMGGGPATAATSGGPTFEVGDSPLGVMPGVRFAGTQSLTASTGPTLTTFTVFMVLRNPPNDASRHSMVPQSNGHIIFNEWEGTVGRWIFGLSQFSFLEFTDATLLGAFCLWTGVYAGPNTKLRANQVQRATGNTGPGPGSNVVGFGNNTGGNPADFTANEVLIYAGEVSASDIDIIEDYLYAKWFLPPVPDAPSDLVATATGPTSIDLEWADNSDDEDGFRIEQDVSGSWVEVDTVAPDETTFTVPGLEVAVSHTFRIVAFNENGDSDPSNEASATTSDPVLPPVIASTLIRDWDASQLTGYADGANVTSWPSLLDASHTLEEPSNAPVFETVSLNDLPGVRFDGNSRLGLLGASAVGPSTYFLVTKNPPASGLVHSIISSPSYLWLGKQAVVAGDWFVGVSDADAMEFIDASLEDEYSLWTFHHNDPGDGESQVGINGLTRETGEYAGFTPSGNFYIGPYESEDKYSQFTMYELLAYDGMVSPADTDTIEAYLMEKWGITPAAPPPDAPTFLSVTAIDLTTIDLAWVDNSDDETGFRIEVWVED
jgi:hypothetical protein